MRESSHLHARDALRKEVISRFGVLPKFFDPEDHPVPVIARLWEFAKSAYLDLPLPSLFKERVFVYLSRFCPVRYCVVRHVGFLMGYGHSAGDPTAPVQTADQVLALLSRPIPTAEALDLALRRLASDEYPHEVPGPQSRYESDVFDALSVMFLQPRRATQAQAAVRHCLGGEIAEMLSAYLAFIRTAHFWTELHPQLAYEPDVISLLQQRTDLAAIVLDPGEAERAQAGETLKAALTELEQARSALAEEQHRTSSERHKLELQLRNREEELARVQKISGVGGINVDVVNGLTGVRSPEYRQVHGLGSHVPRETHEDWLQRIHPDDREAADATLRRALAGNGSYESEHRIVRPIDQEVRWICAKAAIERDADGKATRLIGAHIDVTDLKRTEATLRESEERFRGLVEAYAQAVWETDASGVVVTDSPSWRAYTGQSREQRHGYGWVAAIHPADRQYAEAQWRAAVTAGRNLDAEFRLYHAPMNSYRWTNVRAVPLWGKAGTISKWVGMNIDIEARKQAENRLRESEERLRQFGDASSDILWIRDADTLQWEYLSPAFTTIYGEDRESALRGDTLRNWTELIVAEDRALALDNIARVRAGESVTFECRVCRPKDKQIRWLRNSDFPIVDPDGTVRRIGGIGHDATAEKVTANRMEMLVAELHHRTRNLIAVVRSIAKQTMVTTGPTGTFMEKFSERLAALSRVQGLLSRTEDIPTSIDTLVRMELEAVAAPASIDCVTLEGPHINIRHTVVQTLALAFHELATNASKYGVLAGAGGQLTVRWRVQDERLVVEWIEAGAHPPVGARTERAGYGRQLLESALPYSLNAKTHFRLTADGVHCMIDMPLRMIAVEGA